MKEFSMPQSILQVVSEKGFDGMREIMQKLFNEVMKMERENYLHAKPYLRTDERTDHANGFKPRTINTLQGEIQTGDIGRKMFSPNVASLQVKML